MKMEEKYISMSFDAKRMIQLLGSDLYDSPLAMLRENVQNAYDAILERRAVDNGFTPRIDIELTRDQITITDNGIGMNGDILENNYWKAGNSGKNNEASMNAGVVGHFGIGALANFGVCTGLQIYTHRVGENKRYESYAERDRLNEKSISIQGLDSTDENYGTKVVATLETPGAITENGIIDYLKQYVEYIDVPVFVNGKQIEQKNLSFVPTISGYQHNGPISYKLDIAYNKAMPIQVDIKAYDIIYYNTPLNGYIHLTTQKKAIIGLNNGFGLSYMQLYSRYEFGGSANLTILQPTAGREAVSRESTEIVQNIITTVEHDWTGIIAKEDICDNYRQFLNFVNGSYSIDLAKNIKIKIANEEHYIKLSDITRENADNYLYADGTDKSIVNIYKTSEKIVITTSDVSTRRSIQKRYLSEMGVKPIPNTIQVLHKYDIYKELSNDYYWILSEIKYVIEEDYYVKGYNILFADISHGLKVLAEPSTSNSSFNLYISPESQEINNMLTLKNDNYALFTPIVKDYVRLVLYPQFSSYIPQDLRSRTDYINRVFHNQKEEYIINFSDLGSMEDMIGKLRTNQITPEEFIAYAKSEKKKHTQTITPAEVGDVESVVLTAQRNFINDSQDVKEIVKQEENIPLPPILCLDSETDYRILKTEEVIPVLQNCQMFIALTDRLTREKRVFFTNPHTTRVLWSMHRLIYIFTDAAGSTNLYYDMELTHKIPNNSTDGKSVRTATIITKNKIFVPVVPELYDYFNIEQAQNLKFYVRYDEIKNKID